MTGGVLVTASNGGSAPDLHLKKRVVDLIRSGTAEEALAVLSEFYRVEVPKLTVGTLKTHRKVAALYDGSSRTIYLSNSDFLKDPFVILHEFYHHLRTKAGKHKGTEKYADAYALSFIVHTASILDGLPSDSTRFDSHRPAAETPASTAILASVGENFYVTLDSNPSTGYGWRLAKISDQSVLRLLGTEYKGPEGSPMLGAVGKQILSFEALQEGNVAVTLEYVRPWEKDQPPARVYILDVIVSP